jgi:hypothetical protein
VSGWSAAGELIEARILALLADRPAGATICPSEVARAVAGELAVGDWRELMSAVRSAARRLAARGRLVVTQRGRRVDASEARGAIRLGLPGEAETPGEPVM